MSDDNTPQGTVEDAATDLTSAADALADILDEPEETPDTGKDEAQAEESDEAEDQGEDAEDEAETEESEDSEQEEAETEDDEPAELKGGQFAPKSAKYRLEDGSVVTVEDLVNGQLRQSDYTRKTQDLSRQRDEVKGERERISETTQKLDQQLQTAEAFVAATQPQPPTDQNDPLAFIKYQQQREQWQQWKDAVSAQRDELTEQQKGENERRQREFLERENSKLVEKIPALADPGKRQTFFGEAIRLMEGFGFTKEEIGNVPDHRFVRVMHRLLQLERLQQKAPAAKQDVESKPALLRGSKRGKPTKGKAAKVRADRLAETGSVADGIAALMDLDDD